MKFWRKSGDGDSVSKDDAKRTSELKAETDSEHILNQYGLISFDRSHYQTSSLDTLSEPLDPTTDTNAEHILLTDAPVYNHQDGFRALRNIKNKYPTIKSVVWGANESELIPKYMKEYGKKGFTTVSGHGDANISSNLICKQELIETNNYFDLWKVCYLDGGTRSMTTSEVFHIEIEGSQYVLILFLVDGDTYESYIWYANVFTKEEYLQMNQNDLRQGSGYVIMPVIGQDPNDYMIQALSETFNAYNNHANKPNLDYIKQRLDFISVYDFNNLTKLVHSKLIISGRSIGELALSTEQIEDLWDDSDSDAYYSCIEESIIGAISTIAESYNQAQKNEVKQLLIGDFSNYSDFSYYEDSDYEDSDYEDSDWLTYDLLDGIIPNCDPLIKILRYFPNLDSMWYMYSLDRNVVKILQRSTESTKSFAWVKNKPVVWEQKQKSEDSTGSTHLPPMIGGGEIFKISEDEIYAIKLSCITNFISLDNYSRIVDPGSFVRYDLRIITSTRDSEGETVMNTYGRGGHSLIRIPLAKNKEELLEVILNGLKTEFSLAKMYTPENVYSQLILSADSLNNLVKTVNKYFTLEDADQLLENGHFSDGKTMKIKPSDFNSRIDVKKGDEVFLYSKPFIKSKHSDFLSPLRVSVVVDEILDNYLIVSMPSGDTSEFPVGLLLLAMKQDSDFKVLGDGALYEVIG